MNFSDINESDKRFKIKETFKDKNDVRHLLLCNNFRFSSPLNRIRLSFKAGFAQK